MLSADPIQGLIARCLLSPRLLQQFVMGASPHALQIAPAEVCALDAEDWIRVQKFQAFIIKVKHNALRGVLPNTFRLLSIAGLELQFFMYFAQAYTAARQAGPLPLRRHLDIFGPALAAFLSEATTPESLDLMMEMFDHERLLYELPLVAMAESEEKGRAAERSSVIAQRRFDVVALSEDLRTMRSGSSVRQRTHYLLYQSSHADGTTRLREVDTVTAIIVSQLLAGRSDAEIAQHMSQTLQKVVTSEEISQFSRDVIDAGIVVDSS
jgi:hypothetical protein